MLTRIKNTQTRDCFYPIYKGKRAIQWDTWNNPLEWQEGFWFDDDELPDGESLTGPYPTLDAVCKAQHRYYKAIMSL